MSQSVYGDTRDRQVELIFIFSWRFQAFQTRGRCSLMNLTDKDLDRNEQESILSRWKKKVGFYLDS